MAVKVSRIFHAGYVFESEGVQIAFDPIFENPFSRNCYAYPALEFDSDRIRALNLAAVFTSHHHDDHCSFDSLKLLNRNTPIYMFCVHPVIFDWIRQLGFKNVHALKLGGSVQVGPFEVKSLPALDVDVDSIFQVNVQGLKILNVVDSWVDEITMDQLIQEKPWDLVMWPFQTMRELEVIEPLRAAPSDRKVPQEWLEQLRLLAPKNLIPSSCQFRMEEWSWYNQAFFPISYQLFSEQVEPVLPQTNINRLNPGMSLKLDGSEIKPAESLPWIKVIGNQDVDYRYEPALVPPATSVIAKHFSQLSQEQMIRVIAYCQKELPLKYKEVGPSADVYFNKARFWQLSLFDFDGTEKIFRYKLSDDDMESVETIPQPAEWKTEVIATKLYSALTTGESLTSLYLRVEKAVDVDVVEDPLIRCLFNLEFGTYQKAQLDKILQKGN
ncbi:MBL fold metallo-hydrolase [Bdellovibrio sp. KM01]|uniref:MBL fold metallo-hydrolase n=1 Tax=Bdellovibrio sp. KM01 TaxID=2748865 RepID=UPI0015E8FE22|nr:MBL fold metallo-hydrolase [Bdellovibrio sp. KM01]QLY25231.1 MBL fold metallo-hydrolase [Bdellovibrio sp. KM01]